MLQNVLSKPLSLLALIIIVSALSACGTTPNTAEVQQDADAFDLSAFQLELNNALDDSERLELVRTNIKRLALEHPHFLKQIQSEVPPLFLERREQLTLKYIEAIVLHYDGANQEASHSLAFLEHANWASYLPAEELHFYHEVSASIYASVSNFENAAKSRFFMCTIEADEQCDNNILVWLTEENTSSLSTTGDVPSNWQAWVELAQLVTDVSKPLAAQGQELTQWLELNEHIFFDETPEAINRLIELAQSPRPRTAVLIPLTGNFSIYGNAIRDGYVAGYFRETEGKSSSASLDFFDSNTEDIVTLYNDLAERYDLIVGPLAKERVQAIVDFGDIKVPTLMLNTQDNNPSHPLLYYFGFDLSQEGAEAARFMYESGYRKPLLLLPKTTSSTEIVDNFNEVWNAHAQQLPTEGESLIPALFEGVTRSNDDDDESEQTQEPHQQPIIGDLTVASQYSNEIAAALHITASESRARAISRALGESLEFEPRRRRDIDSIFINASPTQARQIKPLVEFHYGEDLTIFTTSRALMGRQLDQNEDLVGAYIELPPWILYDTATSDIIKGFAPTEPLLQNLFALGVDSYSLGSRLNYLTVVRNAKASGETGQLSIRANNEISRRLFWGVFRRNSIVPAAE